MRCDAIVAIIVTSILALSSPSFAASDADLSKLGDKMSGAFRCSTYAVMFDDQKEAQRLFQIGLKAGRDYVEGMKSSNQPIVGEWKERFGDVSTDFMVGTMWLQVETKAYNEIVKYDDGLPRKQWLDPSEAKSQAELIYGKSNCSLIQ